jgi:hypothetical protein
MAETRVYTQSKSHQDPDGDWLPEPGFGTDRHVINIPTGKKFTRYDLIKLEGGCQIKKAPPASATGKIEIEVEYWYLPLERARYELRVYTGTPEPVTITFGSSNWLERSKQVINQRLPLTITVVGPDARELWRLLNIHPDVNPGMGSRASLARVFDIVDAAPADAAQDAGFAPVIKRFDDQPGGPIALTFPASDPSGGFITVAIIAILAGTVIFGLLAWVLTEAISAGYCADTEFDGGTVAPGEIGLPKVPIILTPCKD